MHFDWPDLASFVTWENSLAVIGSLLYIASVSMKTVIPLRIAAIGSAFFFLLFGLFTHSLVPIVVNTILVPLNSFRLYQMFELIAKVRSAAGGDLSMDWLHPFMTKRRCRKGDILVRKGDPADEMFLAAKGTYRVPELNVTIRSGEIFGELGLLTSEHRRTQSVECIESGHVLAVSYDMVRELYFENPEFGFYLLRLTSDRLLREVRRLETQLAAQAPG